MKIVVNTPDKILMRVLLDIRAENGRPLFIPVADISQRIRRLGQSAVKLYDVEDEADYEACIAEEVDYLHKLGFVAVDAAGAAELTGAGELMASGMDYPSWARSLEQAPASSVTRKAG